MDCPFKAAANLGLPTTHPDMIKATYQWMNQQQQQGAGSSQGMQQMQQMQRGALPANNQPPAIMPFIPQNNTGNNQGIR